MIKGIDVSSFKPFIDYNKVKEAGYKFVIARSSIGRANMDDRFPYHIENAWKYSLDTGVYHLFLPDINPQVQAKNAIGYYRRYAITFPLMIDVEMVDDAPKRNLSNDLAEFIKIIVAETGKTPIIYTAPWFWNRQIDYREIFSLCPLWVADYSGSVDLPYSFHDYIIHQYTNKEQFDGQYLDGNIFNESSYDYQTLEHKRKFENGKVLVNLLNVRKEPNKKSSIVRKLQKNTLVKVLEIVNNWINIGDNEWCCLFDNRQKFIQIF